jgi:pimeloyl-ACP methyl ester carboxylesterase
MRRHLHMTAVLLPLVAWAALLPACVSYQPGEFDRGAMDVVEPIPPEAWPARKTDDLERIARDTPSRIYRYVLDGSKPEDELEPQFREALRRADARIPYSKAFGQGIIRVVRGGPGPARALRAEQAPTAAVAPDANQPSGPPTHADDPARPGSTDFLLRDFFSSVRFVSYSPRDDTPGDRRYERFLKMTSAVQDKYFAERKAGIKVNDPEVLMMLAEGTRIRLIEPARGVTCRGVVVHIAGLGSIQYEEPVLNELLSRGWAVLRIATPRVWWYEDSEFRINTPGDVETTAKRIAAAFDDLLAESAYAAEAALDWLAAERPDLPQRPLALLGCSAGGLVAPAVVARMPDRFDAAVLVGTGSNLLRISQTSDLTDGGVKLRWGADLPVGTLRARLFDRYLAHSVLDPFHTARFLRDKPVLFVHAEYDTTVPAESCHELYLRLGRPDRMTWYVGHRLLFFTLGNQAGRIADWLDRHTTPAANHASESDPPSASQPDQGMAVGSKGS